MKDHTFNGIPVMQMASEDIRRCLAEGVEVKESDGLSLPEAERMILYALKSNSFEEL